MDFIKIYFVGTAGCGKSTLTYAFQFWMTQCNHNAITLNLDPGAESLPYEPDIDIRDWVSLSAVMDEYRLGPNGAQIACADMLAFKCWEVKKEIDTYHGDYLLIDTPGQIELFAFRKSSVVITNVFNSEKSIIVFLYDPILAKSPSGFISLLMLSATVQFRFNLPMVNLLAKIDLLTESELDTILSWSRDPYRIINDLETSIPTLQSNMNRGIFKVLETLGTNRELIPVSSEELYGMEDLYNSIQQVFAGGEDLE